MDISGGSVDKLSVYGYSTITFHGRDFRIGGGDLTIDSEQRVTGTGHLSGEWMDGTRWVTYIDIRDSNAMVKAIINPYLPGDANGDGQVTDADYTIWSDTYGSTTDLWADWNDSGEVTDSDYTIWADNYGTGVPGVAVPEPATLSLLALGGLALIHRRK